VFIWISTTKFLYLQYIFRFALWRKNIWRNGVILHCTTWEARLTQTLREKIICGEISLHILHLHVKKRNILFSSLQHVRRMPFQCHKIITKQLTAEDVCLLGRCSRTSGRNWPAFQRPIIRTITRLRGATRQTVIFCTLVCFRAADKGYR
jgi:hypothetical protein